ncbi:emp24/gp25L/p24 family protein NDAI_0A08430 [Naumovozyma dairenensis CBS 421]|uniref:GOLD domain-containing protein n=1 Tax=Naumovozyma dairenensis (strain ATCC 10597 / BCRC 20456 / CBS 421 / NBRC 0211 / NRRL Y-12639) TaxID=1071378 RepID=G0W5A8_NAUDC|nr:hypothetical protein NDAI_0A08430 [Naumovozyma dairenensis CBS 421]CCD22996.1 hypothetical protein NDAI_0A08430 [Naumovozyma dairenensis CBS 421]
MYGLTIITVLMMLIHPVVSSIYTPMAVTIPARGKECLYYDMQKDDDVLVVSYQVLTGGDFEINFQITSPDGEQLVDEKRKKYSDFLLKSFGLGPYEFCFDNGFDGIEKKVEFTLELENNVLKAETNEEDMMANNSIEEIDRNIDKISKMLKYLRAREWRNMYTVESTKSRLRWLSLLDMSLMAGISCIQAIIIELFFKNRNSNYV